MPTIENPLEDTRLEYVEETTTGEPPTDPDFKTFTDFLQDFSVSPGPTKEAQSVVGSGDFRDIFRGPEEPSLTLEYFKERPFTDTNDDPQYPAAYPLTYRYDSAYPTFTVEYRRDVSRGGTFGAGFREYVVVLGAKPSEVTLPGDPSEAQPITEELTLEPEKARAYVINQPDTSTTLDVANGGSNSVDVTIEDEGAATTETVTVAGNSTTTTTASFDNIDAIFVEAEPDGDISVTDGSGTDVLDTPITGSATDGVEGERGVPALGSGSRGSGVGGTPEDYLFLGVDAIDWVESPISDRIHALDLSVSLDVAREAQTGTRRQAVDIGPRTVEVDADLAGPHESADLIADTFRAEQSDLVYQFPDEDVAVKNAEIVDAPDITRSAGETNFIPSATLQGKTEDDAAAIVVTNTE